MRPCRRTWLTYWSTSGPGRTMSNAQRTAGSASGLAERWLRPSWPASPRVRAFTTTRQGGRSAPPWNGLNLAHHVGDDAEAVCHNRALFGAAGNLPQHPPWLNQVHGTTVVTAAAAASGVCQADAVVAHQPIEVCAVLTADCLPVLLCDRAGTRVGAAHAGWRGLAAGILEATIDALGAPEHRLLAWLGPAISIRHFEVGEEVREIFIRHDPQAVSAFSPARPGHWRASLYRLARQRLAMRGVRYVYGGGLCTYTDAQRFFSFRRDGITGRMASVIWIADCPTPA